MSNNNKQILRRLFFSYAIECEEKAAHSGQRFVYYTQAETAVKILRNREIWLRSASLMNDASEIRHGMECMKFALERGGAQLLRDIIESAHPKLVDDQIDKLLRASEAMFAATFICCVSEHDGRPEAKEDKYGRLSMWRAYGGKAGIAFVFNPIAMLSPSNALSAYTSPVVYKDPEDFSRMFLERIQMLANNAAFVREQPRADVETDMYEMLHFAVLSIKHPAFAEEREWRIIYAPYHEASNRVKSNTECIRGIPQLVYKLPLMNVPDEGLTGLEITESLDRLIIGPCDHPTEMSFAFHEELKARGIEKPYEKIVISGVPLRT